MKIYKKIAIILIFIITLSIPASVNAVSTTSKGQSFINALADMNTKIKKDYSNGKVWKYSNSNLAKTFKLARNGNKKMDCAKGVTWALIKIGVFSKGDYVYKSSSKITYSSTSAQDKLHSNATIKNIVNDYKNAQTVYSLELKGAIAPGDIICYETHMNVYMGNGYFYDCGSTFTTVSSKKYTKGIYGYCKDYYKNTQVTRTIHLK